MVPTIADSARWRTRILSVTEYARLQGTELELAWPHLPLDAEVVALEDGDRLIGCVALFVVPHLEGLWIHPDYRKRTPALHRLWTAAKALLRDRDIPRIIGGAVSDEMHQIIEHIDGTRLPGAMYVIPIGD